MAKNTRVISVASSKGGCGKSTVTMHLASALAKDKGKKVLIIDTDSQRTIMDFFEGETMDGVDSLVTVEEMAGRQVLNFLKRFGSDYDIVFIDIPRMTEKKGDAGATTLLSYCDSVLIPVIGSQVDILSTLDFIEIIKQIAKERKSLDFEFTYASFINRRNRRKDNEIAENFLKEQNLKVFNNSLNDLKVLSNPSLYNSILDSKVGKERFEQFYKEFCKIYKI
jgi:chromosome partitioning protein